MKNLTRYILPLLLVQLLAPSLFAEQEGHGTAHKHEHHDAQSPNRSDSKRLWCKEHQRYEDECIICHPELRDKGRLWCKEHNRYEDRCWLCHPEIEDKDRPYCSIHFFYTDECEHLHPEKEQKDARKTEEGVNAKKAAALFCKEHDLPERECGICHPELLGSIQSRDSLKLRLPSDESFKLVGLKVAPPEIAPLEEAVASVGGLRFNGNRTAHIVAPVRGVIKEVHVDLGDMVSTGTGLASIWSPAIAEAASKAVLAAQTLLRVERLRKKGITSAKDLEQAAAHNRAAVQRLQSLGFSDKQIDSLRGDGDAPVVLTVSAPFDSEIVERSSVQGEFVEIGASLFTVTDTSTLWAMLSIPATKLAQVQKGQKVKLTTSALPQEEFTGKLTWISASIDSKTRMARARAEVENPDGRLRDNMYVNARIITRETKAAYLVPQDAVHKIENVSFVFIKLQEDLFQIQPVKLGVSSAGKVEVLSGLSSDFNIVSDKSHILKSQFLISRLGAGCVH